MFIARAELKPPSPVRGDIHMSPLTELGRLIIALAINIQPLRGS
jgi:hypothetical protein